ncbi:MULTISPECIES: hypothetical protein [Bradyrhizobium]|uniref:hypothetical protein n=1 Tax=Bradyrhizobium TaxID=374 RepID=UPI001EDA9D8F|nr:hypothetical protein [Bradyrhizobium zhengyangense]MCG2645313.1 hypothetical protein [Bradyrhizobium zhengyangense]
MTDTIGSNNMHNNKTELTAQDLEKVSGGMKTDPNHVSSDVIDARGGSLTFMGLTFTSDVNGKVHVS